MGYMRHDAIIMVVSHYVFDMPDIPDPDVTAFRESLPEEWRQLVVGPVATLTNGYVMYVFLPDGSKEGWDTSNAGDEYRSRFRELFKFTYENGSSPFDGVEIQFGGDEPEWIQTRRFPELDK